MYAVQSITGVVRCAIWQRRRIEWTLALESSLTAEVACLNSTPPPLPRVVYGRKVLSAQLLEVSLLGVGAVLRLERDGWSEVKRQRRATK